MSVTGSGAPQEKPDLAAGVGYLTCLASGVPQEVPDAARGTTGRLDERSAARVVGLVGGDDWALSFTVYAADGTIFDLTGATVLWTFYSARNTLIASGEVGISMTDAAKGECLVLVPAAVTTRIGTGVFYHALRIVCGGLTTTPFLGNVSVTANPFTIPVAAAAEAPQVIRLAGFVGLRALSPNPPPTTPVTGPRLVGAMRAAAFSD